MDPPLDPADGPPVASPVAPPDGPLIGPPAPAGTGEVDGGRADVVGRHGRLVRRTVLVSALTLVSRVLGYVRESLMGAVFGHTSAVYDALITAWRVPNLFRRLLGEGAISTSLQTTLTEVDADRGNAAGRELFLRTVFITAWITAVLCGLVMLLASFAPDRLPITGWAWLGADPSAVRELTVRVMPYVVLVCLAALASGALQVRGEFKISSLAPTMLNVAWVSVLVYLIYRYGFPETTDDASQREIELDMARFISRAIVVSGLLQLAVLTPALARHGLLRRLGRIPQFGFDVSKAAWGVIKASAPLALGAAVYQVNVMIDGLMAQGMLETGGPTAYHFATRVQQFPVALVAVSATAAVFPSLKALGHLGRRDELRALHDRAQRGVCFLSLPAMAGLIALSAPICALLFQHGRFGEEGVVRTSAALATLAIAVLPTGAVALVSRAYYAMGDFRTPVRVSIVMLVVNMALNVAFVAGLGMDANGFAASTALTSWVNLIVLWPGLHRRLALPKGERALAGVFARMLAAALTCALSARGVYVLLIDGAPRNGARAIFAISAAIAAGAFAYGALAALLRVPEWSTFQERIRLRWARLWDNQGDHSEEP